MPGQNFPHQGLVAVVSAKPVITLEKLLEGARTPALFVLLGGAPTHTQVAPWRLLAGGFLVGFGSRLGGGCTSGHGICGLASLQRPSLAAVVTFLATGMATAQLVARLGISP